VSNSSTTATFGEHFFHSYDYGFFSHCSSSNATLKCLDSLGSVASTAHRKLSRVTKSLTGDILRHHSMNSSPLSSRAEQVRESIVLYQKAQTRSTSLLSFSCRCYYLYSMHVIWLEDCDRLSRMGRKRAH